MMVVVILLFPILPIANNVVLTATAGTCEETLTVNAPNCNCPTVNAPVSGGDETICQGDVIPTLTVTVGVGQTANWYSYRNRWNRVGGWKQYDFLYPYRCRNILCGNA